MADTPITATRTVLTQRTIILGALIVLTVGIGAAVTLFVAYPPHDARSAVEIIRTAGTIAVGTGGGAGLLLAARRQQTTEEANADVREANEHTRHDAEERRISDLQASAGEQLGNDKAAVRLNGLYQLERLGQNYPDHRPTVVNVICAYLRMPFTHPDKIPTRESEDMPEQNPSNDTEEKINQAREELQVRLTAQRLLRDHLRPEPDHNTGEPTNEKYWDSISLDLTAAVLIDFDLTWCRVNECQFIDAHFESAARFTGTHFHGRSQFVGAHFAGEARFGNAHFHGPSWFVAAHFNDTATFHRACFEGSTQFGSVDFQDMAVFDDTHFAERAGFADAHFGATAQFEETQFEGSMDFDNAHFDNGTNCRNARIPRGAALNTDVWPEGWTFQLPKSLADGRIKGKEGVWGYIVEETTRAEPQHESTPDQRRQ